MGLDQEEEPQRSGDAAHQRKSHLDLTAVLMPCTCCAIWGLGQVAIKLTLAGVGLLAEPLTLRLVVALMAVCTGICLVSRRGGR